MSNEPFRKKALRGDSEKMLIPKSRLLNCEWGNSGISAKE
jgi:hypothetical protein